nr:unnamed protein product [Callosobruchus chinensis]
MLFLPISVARGEQSFSSLKFIKNYLRTRISQERSNNLALISIESTICESLHMKDIREFASIKARNVDLFLIIICLCFVTNVKIT